MSRSELQPRAFGQMLRERRREAGLTQAALAERAGISTRAVQHLEGAYGQPHPDTARRLAQALALAPEHLDEFVAAASPSPRTRAARRPAERNDGDARAVVATDTPAPPPSSLREPMPLSRLPVQLASFVGRQDELHRARTVLLRPGVRLLTMTGPPGTGKTRLAVELAAQVADAFADGVAFVSLAMLNDPEFVMGTIAQTLEVLVPVGATPLAAVTAFLREREALLVLDNFEQVLPSALQVVELLGACPGLRVLVTSRAALRVRGEHELVVTPLPLPDPRLTPDIDTLLACASVALFVERAQAVRADFSLTDDNAGIVAEICVRLDGLPLAIELAAARSRLFAPPAMLARLERRLPMLTGGALDMPARQQRLHDTIAWSHELLGVAEKTVFRRLAVFVGGSRLDAIKPVCDPDGEVGLDVTEAIFSLVGQSLVYQREDPDGEPRFGMLETIREFASEQLDASGEAPIVRDRHLGYMLALAGAAKAAGRSAQQNVWIDRVEADHDNVRAALAWSVGATPGAARSDQRIEAGISLAENTELVWALRARGRECFPMLMALLNLTPPASAVRARALTVAGFVRGDLLGDYAGAREMVDEALRIWQTLDDVGGIAVALERQGRIALAVGQHQQATAAFSEARDLFRALGRASSLVVPIALELAWSLQAQGDHDRAEALYEEVLVESRTLGDSHTVALALQGFAGLRSAHGDIERAVTLLHESLSLFGPLRDIRCAPSCLEELAFVLADSGAPATVARILSAAEGLREFRGRPRRRHEQEAHDRVMAKLKLRADEASLDAAWAEGRAMDLDQAVAYAIADGVPS